MSDSKRQIAAARKIVKEILADLTDRRGLRQAWEAIDDEDIQEEIKAAWVGLALKELEAL